MMKTTKTTLAAIAAVTLALSVAACQGGAVQFLDQKFDGYSATPLTRPGAANSIAGAGLASDPQALADAVEAEGFIAQLPENARERERVRLHLVAGLARYRAGPAEWPQAEAHLDEANTACTDDAAADCILANTYLLRLRGMNIVSDAAPIANRDWSAVAAQAQDYDEKVFAEWGALPEGQSTISTPSNDLDRNGRLMALCEVHRAYGAMGEWTDPSGEAGVAALQQTRAAIQEVALNGLGVVGHTPDSCSGDGDPTPECLRAAWRDTIQLCTNPAVTNAQ